MGMFDSISISASGLTAERTRLDVISENLANANTTRGADGRPYQRKTVVLQEVPLRFSDALGRAMGGSAARGSDQPGGVQVAAIVGDGNPPRRVYDPGNPDADAQGYVLLPNVNPVTEMTDMVSASHSYEANITALNTEKQMFTHTFDALK